MKEQIRDNIDMIYNNIGNFNNYALQWIDKKVLRKFISIWRWYVSHDYFNEKHPQLTGLSSNPPLPWLNGQLEGLSVPLHRDIAECIAPKVQSSIKTEQAARRIMNRMNMIYAYVTPEAAKADQQAHRDREDKKAKDRLRAQKAVVDRKAIKKAEQIKFIVNEGPKLAKARLKKKEQERKQLRLDEELKRKSVHDRAMQALHKMKKEQRERSK